MLAGPNVTLEARGFGEKHPMVRNIVGGKPNGANWARNRRVEIIVNVKQ
jgi:outer membrane protein OmpA-like peptidoglycan-associated protein